MLINSYPANIFLVLKIPSAYYICCKNSNPPKTNFVTEVNIMDPDQAAPKGSARSGSIMFAINATKVHHKVSKLTIGNKQKVLSEGVQLLNWLLLLLFFQFNMRGERIQIPPLYASHHRPPAKRHFNGNSLACPRWPNIECCLSSLVIFQGIRTSITKKPNIFVILQGGGGGSGPPTHHPLDPCMELHERVQEKKWV